MAHDQQESTFRFSIKQLLLVVLVAATFLAGRATRQQDVMQLKVDLDGAWRQAELLRDLYEQERYGHQVSLQMTGSAPEDISATRLDFMTLDLSPDDQYLVTGGMTTGVRVWDIASSRLLHTLAGPQRGIRSVSFASRGMIAAGGDEGIVFLWNQNDPQPLRRFGVEGAHVLSLAFSPDGSRLAACVNKLLDGSPSGATVRLWNPVSGEQILDLPILDTYCRQVKFSPDGTILATVGRTIDGKESINLWELKSGAVRWNVSLHQWSASSVAFSADGTQVAMGGGVVLSAEKGVHFVGEVKVWDSSSGRLLQTLKGNESGRFEDISFSPIGNMLVGGATGPNVGLRGHRSGSTLQAWDAQSGESLWHLVEGSAGIRALDFSHDGHTLVTCDGEAIRLVDPRNGTTVSVLHYGQP